MKPALRKLVTRSLILLLLLLNSNAFASHIVGLELFYTHVALDTYKITLVAYGDCGPASAGAFSSLPSASPVICVYNGSSSVASVSLTIQAPTTGVEITPVCSADSLLTQCTNNTFAIPGIKKFVYSAKYRVTSPSAFWRFVFTGNMGPTSGSAGRAAAITNILSGTITQLVDTLNNTIYNNSNPLLTTVPVPFFCLNVNDSYNPGAVDPDGDSLSFFLVPGVVGSTNCVSAGGTPVSYTGGYSGTAPLGVLPGSFTFDQATGQITFIPNVLQRALVVYNIEEYRSGSFVGSCQREMTFLVLTCTDIPPTGTITSASGGTITDSTHFKICENSGLFSLTITPIEADTFNTITVSATGLPAGSAFTITNNGTNHPVCTFSWSSTGVTPGTYIFYLTFRDNACPISGTQTRAFSITVLPQPNITASGGATLCQGASTTLSATGGSTYTWLPGIGLSCTTCSSTTATPSGTTIYTVTGVDTSGCSNFDTVSVRILPLPTISAGPDLNLCIGGSGTLSATGGVSYIWAASTGLSCTTCTSTTASPTTTRVYTLTGVGANGCINTDTVRVTINPLPTIDAGPHVSVCIGSGTTLSPTGGTSYVWAAGTTLSCTSCTSPIASPTVATTYTVTGTDANGCVNTDTVSISVNPLPTIDAGPNVTFCLGVGSVLSPTGGASYIWSPGTGLSCTACPNPTANPTTTTLYTVTGTDINGCSKTDTVRVTIKPLPTIDAGPAISFCIGSGGSSLSGSGGMSYVWTPGTGLSCTTCSSPVASPATTTVYTLTGVGANGCSGFDTVRVTVNPLPAVDAGLPTSVCIGSGIPLSPSGAVSYVWIPGTGLSCTSCTSPIASPTVTTVYTVTGTDANGCVNKDTVRISTYLAPPIDAGPAVSICIGASTTLLPTGGATYVWATGTGLSCTSCTSPTASPTTTTVYTVTGTDIFGCFNTDTVRITVKPLPTIDAGPHAIICTGLSTTLASSGGVSYVWIPGTGLSCTSCASPTASPGTTTIYTVAGTGSNGCQNTDTVSIAVNPLPIISAGAPVDYCIGGNTTLTASGGLSYVWSPGTTLSCTSCVSPVAAPTVTTTYTVSGTDANGCVNTSTVAVNVHTLPPVDAGPNTSVCIGLGVMLSPSGAVSYVWTPGTSLSCTLCANPTASPTATIVYSVTGTDAWGCENSDTVKVTVNPLPTIDAGPPKTICLGTTTTLVPFGGISYVWGPGTGLSCSSCTSPIASPSGTTIYTVTGTDINGCKNTDTASVTVKPLPVIDAGTPIAICIGGSTILTAAGGVSYTWTPGTGLSCATCSITSAAPTSTTVYTVTGIGSNGCVNKDTVSVIVNLLPTINAGPAVNLCMGYGTTLTGTGGASYYWTPGTGLSCMACTSPVATPTVTIIYTVTGTAATGCINTDTVTVFVNPIPVVTVSGDATKCAGDPYNITATGGGTYLWTPAAGLSCNNCSIPVATPTVSTSYTVTVTNSFGCSQDAFVTVNINPIPVLSIAPSPVNLCLGRDTTITVTGALYYTWSPGTGLNTTTGPVVIAGPVVSTIYTITGTDANNCKATATELVTVGAIPDAPVVVSPVDYCITAAATSLSATGINLLWYTTPFGGTGSLTAPIPATGTPGATWYYVSQTMDGCESWRDSIKVMIYEDAKVDFELEVGLGCNFDSVIFTNTSPNATYYLWTFHDGKKDTAKDPIHFFNPVADPSTYWVKLYGYNPVCNADSTEKTFTLYPAPPVHMLHDITPDQAIPYGSSIHLSVYGAWIYFWKPDDGSLDNNNINNPIARPLVKTPYVVYGYDHTGCIDSAHVTIDVTTTDEGIPSAFTPNGDGDNDIFQIANLKHGKLVEMRIYNRWGQLVCKTIDNNKGWDGTFEGVKQDMGVYNYYIIIERENRKEVHYKGDITLIR